VFQVDPAVRPQHLLIESGSRVPIFVRICDVGLTIWCGVRLRDPLSLIWRYQTATDAPFSRHTLTGTSLWP